MRISDWSSDVCSSDLPGREEIPVRRRGVECLKVRETRGRAIPQRQIGAAAGPHEDFSAAVLVDEDQARDRLFGLREPKLLDDSLAPDGRADETPMPDVAIVEIEIIG